MQKKFVDKYHWIENDEMLDLVAIAQSSPGPIAVNAATFVGTKMAGTPGALVATFGCILPSCIIVTILAYLYMKYRHLDMMKVILRTLRPAFVALIATAGASILVTSFYPNQQFLIFPVVLFGLSMFLLRAKKMNPITVMVLAGVINVIVSFI